MQGQAEGAARLHASQNYTTSTTSYRIGTSMFASMPNLPASILTSPNKAVLEPGVATFSRRERLQPSNHSNHNDDGRGMLFNDMVRLKSHRDEQQQEEQQSMLSPSPPISHAAHHVSRGDDNLTAISGSLPVPTQPEALNVANLLEPRSIEEILANPDQTLPFPINKKK